MTTSPQVKFLDLGDISMRKFLAAGALFATLQAASPAFAVATDVHTIIGTFTPQNVSALAASAGYQAEILTDSGQTAVGITAPDGLKFLAQPVACQNGKCLGLVLFAIFKDTVSGDVLSAFNKQHVFTSSFADSSATYVARDEICDYGIPAGNVVSNFSNFDAVVQLFIQFAQSGGTGASLTPAPGTPSGASAFGSGSPVLFGSDKLYKPTPAQQAYFNHIGK